MLPARFISIASLKHAVLKTEVDNNESSMTRINEYIKNVVIKCTHGLKTSSAVRDRGMSDYYSPTHA